MRWSRSRRSVALLCGLLALAAGAMAGLVSHPLVRTASAADVGAAIEKANLYIEVAKLTERAVDSWDRYASWVNLKTGPTGKERYLSYGMYELYDVSGLLNEARKAAGRPPATPKLDAAMKRYMDAYDAAAPVMNQANDYYERKGYQADGMAAGKALHARMVPLVKTLLTEREAMLRDLRVFAREVEQQELAAVEAREGRTRAWQVANVMHAANRLVDLFPRIRPTPIDADTLDEKLKAIGPNTPGAKLDEIIAGVVVQPQNVVIDMKQFDGALKGYAAAVETFDRFAAEKPDGLRDFKAVPRQLLGALRALQEPLARNQGRDFEGSAALVGRAVQTYFSLLNEGSSLASSRLRFLQ